jgi:DegV family protein with EDD domain
MKDEGKKKVAVVTDSTATVPQNLVHKLNIRVVPTLLVFGHQTFRDGLDITATEVYQRLRAGAQIPTSAAPSVGDFLRVYAAAGQESSGIISIHMSPNLSSTYSVALTASGLVDGVPIRVLDCQTAAMGQGFVVLEAARAAAQGATLEQVLRRAEDVASRTRLLFTLDTFEYLQRGGRIGLAAALAGTLLQIKPVLYLDGQVDVLAKTRTRPKAIQLILQKIDDHLVGRTAHVAILHADAPQEAESLRKMVAERFECAELLVTEFTPVMGAHTGPGLLGVAYYAE